MGGKEHNTGLSLGVHSIKAKANTLYITAGYSKSDAITRQKATGALANKITLVEKLPKGNYKVKLNLINLGFTTAKPDWDRTGSLYTSDYKVE